MNSLLVEEFEMDAQALLPEASLKNDLEIDSLDFVDIVVMIDSEFGFKPKTEDLKHLKTLSDFHTYIAEHI